MIFFVDFEFDGPDIISLALVPVDESKASFYEVAQNTARNPWVKKNVLPVLCKEPIGLPSLRELLESYLSTFDEWTFIADWPTDIALLANLLHNGDGTMMRSPKSIEFRVWRIDAPSLNRHNALADAEGLRDYCKAE